MDTSEIALRLGAATAAGLFLGFDRELRGSPAGLRTHALVALSSAAITVSALKLQEQFGAGNSELDPLRVIQGLAQAIGFIAAGIIFATGGKVKNVTTAANLWLASAVGIAAGAAQFDIVGIALVLGFVLLVGVGFVERRWLPAQAKEEGASADKPPRDAG